VGVPLITPAVDIVNVDGSPLAVQVMGVLPPVDVAVRLYATPAEPLVNDVVVTDKTPAMFKVSGLETLAAVGVVESVTVTVTAYVPPVFGVPVMVPPVDIDNVDGRPLAVQVSGELPPVADSGVLYARPDEPFGRAPVVIDNAGAIVNGNVLLVV
jgi:hypothetical protein